jgi:hypothetical protein
LQKYVQDNKSFSNDPMKMWKDEEFYLEALTKKELSGSVGTV